jgi:FSR family fosmidomycin resistance protein-like MFS transporter
MNQVIVSSFGAQGSSERRTLVAASGAHVLHDGYTDLLYVLLSVWQAEFLLSFTQVGMIRALYAGTTAGFQVPAGFLAERVSGKTLLIAGALLSAAGFVVAGFSAGIGMLMCALVIGGIGGSAQHPVASNLVSRAFEGPRSRGALGIYNFAGDIGKMAFPAATAGLLLIMPWRAAIMILAGVGVLAAIVMWFALPAADARAGAHARPESGMPVASQASAGAVMTRGFSLLLGIGIIDSATRMGFLTFLPFLLAAKGASLQTVGVALTLIFAGGAAGKLICAWLGSRFGVLHTVYITEGVTALGILALLPLPLEAGLAILPVMGAAVNGTSSVLYGTVPELVSPARRERAFGIFYTGAIGAGALAPALYGLFSDALGVPKMMVLVAAVVLFTLPLAWLLNPWLAAPGAHAAAR